MEIPTYQVDAFTGEIFKGNLAAICILQEWIDDKLMQNSEMDKVKISGRVKMFFEGEVYLD